MTPRVIGRLLFTDGLTRPVYEDERGQSVVEDGERIDGVWLVPEDDRANTPLIVRNTPSALDGEDPTNSSGNG
jgi:hypothetical protein